MRLIIDISIVLFSGVVGGVFWRAIINFFILFSCPKYELFTHFGPHYIPPLKTSVVLSLTAFSILLLCKLLKVKTYKDKLIVCVGVLLIAIFTVVIRVLIITSNSHSMEIFDDPFASRSISLDSDLQIWLYMFVGLFLGLGITWLICQAYRVMHQS